MTADSNFVLYHDKNLSSKTNRHGYPEQTLLSDLETSKYQLGYPFDLFQEEKVISLASLINYLNSLDQFPILQLDLRNYCECFSPKENENWEREMTIQLNQFLLEAQVPLDKIQILSPSKNVIFHAKKIESPFIYVLELYDVDSDLSYATENELKLIAVKRSILTKEMSARVHQLGIGLITYEAKSDQGNQRMILKNPDYIQTNNLPSLNKLLEIN